MDEQHESDAGGRTPVPERGAPPEDMEQAQKQAAEKRAEGGGYGG